MATLAADALAYWQASNYSGSGQWLDESGNGHHITLAGNSIFVPYDNQQHYRTYGAVGNIMTVPDSAALDITSDIEIIVKMALDDYTPASNEDVIAKMPSSGNTGYALRVMATSGNLNLLLGTGSLQQAQSSVSLSTVVSDGDRVWVKVTWDQSTGDINFYYSTADAAETDHTAVTWTQLGTTVSGTTSAVSANADIMTLTAFTSSLNTAAGKFYAFVVKSGIGGTVQLDVNMDDATEPFNSFTEASSNAATVTISRATTIGTFEGVVVAEDCFFLDGGNDRLWAADDAALDFGAADDFSVVIVFRVGRTNTTETLISKYTGTTGWYLQSVSGTFTAGLQDGGGNPTDTIAGLTTRIKTSAGLVRNTTDDDIEAFVDGTGSGTPTTDSTTGSLATAQELDVGVIDGSLQDYFGHVIAAAVFAKALTDAEMAEIHTELTTGVAASSGGRSQLQQGHIGLELRSGI